MNMMWTATVLLVVVTLDQTFVSAVDRLCINGDNSIRKLYIDGKDFTSKLVNRNDVRKCDCITIPFNSGVIAVEAENLKGTSGIQSCTTARSAVKSEWHCRPIKKAQSPNWYKRGFNSRGWKPAQARKCDHCRQFYQMPCRMSENKCYWSNKPSSVVRCIRKQCGLGCTGCKKPGTCDLLGKCIYDAGTNVRTNKTTCNRRCSLVVKAWNATESPNGYIRVTDLLTRTTDTWKANVAGNYYATVDMTDCTLTNRVYSDWPNASVKINVQTFLQWNSDGATGENFRHVIGVELGVGAGIGSFSPWIGVTELGLGTAVPKYANNKYRRFRAVLRGVQNGKVAVTKKKLNGLDTSGTGVTTSTP